MTEVSRMLGIHPRTLKRHLIANGIPYKFSTLSDADLDNFVKTFKSTRPNSGIRYLIGSLRNHGLRVQKRRIKAALSRVDLLGKLLRRRNVIQRRKYSVARPNALWHVDGHHKLILWGIVIHGFVDGYCRTLTGLQANTNNRASTVLKIFLDAIEIYGMPSRLRGDYGGENKDISTYMILARGANRASFIWGPSTRNTRIERIWVEDMQFKGQFMHGTYVDELDGIDPAIITKHYGVDDSSKQQEQDYDTDSSDSDSESEDMDDEIENIATV
ncbi:hypothetical protein H0H92_011419, partial [Tricholoma furcatifolium]